MRRMTRRWARGLVAAGIAVLVAVGMLGISPAGASTSPAWSLVRSPNAMAQQDRLAGVSCPTASSCVAVGQSVNRAGARVPLVKSWNGRRWTLRRRVPVPVGAPNSALEGVSCASARACIAVEGFISAVGAAVPLAERWNGRSWATQTMPGAAKFVFSFLNAVSCASASACTAVGYTTGFDTGSAVPLAETWNGTAWVIQATPSAADSGSLAGASCSPAGCTAVGASINHRRGSQVTLAERWNGATWTIQATRRNPAGAQNNALAGVSCTSGRKCIAVGSAGLRTLAERWDGTAWTIQPTAAGVSTLHEMGDPADSQPARHPDQLAAGSVVHLCAGLRRCRLLLQRAHPVDTGGALLVSGAAAR